MFLTKHDTEVDFVSTNMRGNNDNISFQTVKVISYIDILKYILNVFHIVMYCNYVLTILMYSAILNI